MYTRCYFVFYKKEGILQNVLESEVQSLPYALSTCNIWNKTNISLKLINPMKF